MADPSDEDSSEGSDVENPDGKKKGWYTKWQERKAEKKKNREMKK